MAIRKRDFSRLKHFPATLGNPFDVVLRAADIVEALPGPLFAALLAVMSAVAVMVRGEWPAWVAVWAFFLGDGAPPAALPRLDRSLGPAKPPALLLAALRLPSALLPLPWMLAAQALGTALDLQLSGHTHGGQVRLPGLGR